MAQTDLANPFSIAPDIAMGLRINKTGLTPLDSFTLRGFRELAEHGPWAVPFFQHSHNAFKHPIVGQTKIVETSSACNHDPFLIVDFSMQ